MCLICIEYQAKRLTAHEAWNNLDEMASGMDAEHVKEVVDMIVEDLDFLNEDEFCALSEGTMKEDENI